MDIPVSEPPREESVAPERPLIWRVMLQVLAAPAQGFKGVKDYPRWLIPCILCVMVLLVQEVLIRPQTLNDLKQTVQNDASLTSAEVQARMEMLDYQLEHSVQKELLGKGLVLLSMIHFGKVLGLALLIWIVLLLLSDGVTYRQALSVSALAFLVVIPESIVRVPVVMAHESTRVYLGLAVLIPADLHKTALFRVFRDLDVFTIWIAFLIALGLSVGLGVPRRHAYLLVSGLLGCRVLLSIVDIVFIGTS